jgi:aminoglycoside phosphotransferase (APT) family kinase protein
VNRHRLQWEQLPRALQTTLEALVGARVVASSSGTGGYSPSLASRCDLDDGRRVFVKAVSAAQNPETPGMLRREVDVTRLLPPEVPAPSLLHSFDDEDWVAAVFEYVEGRAPLHPWRNDELRAVCDAAMRLGEVSVGDELHAVLPLAQDRLAPLFDKWETLTASPPAGIDPWIAANLDVLAKLESGWRDAVAGDSLLHNDVRSDNTLIEQSGRVVFVDWAHPCIGASWVDLVCMVPSVVLEGGRPEDVLAPAGASMDDAAVDALLAAILGYFVERGTQPDPPGLPTVRAFQRAQGEVTLRWLRTRLGDPAPQ